MELIKKRPILWWVLLACALAASIVLLAGRISAESGSMQVCAAMEEKDLEVLVRESGIPEQQWRERLGAVGVKYFVNDIYTDLPAMPLVENRARTSVIVPEGFDVKAYDGPMVKTLYLFYKYGVRVIDNDPQEVEDLLFRAVMDRGERLLVITPFFDKDNSVVADIEVYERCLSDLAERLQARGISCGEDFSCLDAPQPSVWLVLAAGIAPALVGAWRCLPCSHCSDLRSRRRS